MAFLVQSTGPQIQQRIVGAYNAAATAAGIPVASAGPGGSLGAIFNAIVAESVDLQQQTAYAAAITRLQTSMSNVPGVNSPDVDSFIAPFGFSRNAAVAATTSTTWTSPSPAPIGGLTIAAGTYCQAAPGTQFIVVPDVTQPGWNAGLNAYVIAFGATTVNVTVQAAAAGLSGNVQANTITQILSLPNAPAPTGITTVNNPTAVTNGANAETDAAVVTRFQNGMAGRWATPLGVSAAVSGSQSGLTFQIGDMLLSPSGATQPNFFSVIANTLGQNTAPTAGVLAAITAAVNANRPCGMPYSVQGPVLSSIAVGATLTLLSGAVPATVVAAANAALATFLNGIGLAPGIFQSTIGTTMTCRFAAVSSLLLGIAGVGNVTNLQLNGATSDVSASFGAQLVAGTITLATA